MNLYEVDGTQIPDELPKTKKININKKSKTEEEEYIKKQCEKTLEHMDKLEKDIKMTNFKKRTKNETDE